jgi:hypothetical protein
MGLGEALEFLVEGHGFRLLLLFIGTIYNDTIDITMTIVDLSGFI